MYEKKSSAGHLWINFAGEKEVIYGSKDVYKS